MQSFLTPGHPDSSGPGEQQVGMTQPSRVHIDQHFASDRRRDLHVLEIEPVPQRVNDKCLHADAGSLL
jgi:hypothetical protein